MTPGNGSSENEEGGDGERVHRKESERDPEKQSEYDSKAERHPTRREVFEEGDDRIIENEDGDVLDVQKTPSHTREAPQPQADLAPKNFKGKFSAWRHRGEPVDEEANKTQKRGAALAYQFGNTVCYVRQFYVESH